MTTLTAACGGAEPAPDGGWTAQEWTGPSTVFAGQAAPQETAGSAAPKPKPKPQSEATPDAGMPVEQADAAIADPAPVAGAGGAAGSGAAGQAAVMPTGGTGGASGSPAPVHVDPVEVVLCTAAVHGVAPAHSGTMTRVSSSIYATNAGATSGTSLAKATAYVHAVTMAMPSPVMSAELLSPADATKTAALRTLQSIEVGYIFVDPSAASTDWPQQSKIVPCALAAGDTVTGYYAKSTFSISTLAIDAVGEVRGYRAQ